MLHQTPVRLLLLLLTLSFSSAKLLVTVGSQSYTQPYSQYPSAVEEVLQQALKDERPRGSRPPRDDGPYNDADWMIQLALAHRSVIEDEMMSTTSSVELTTTPEEIVEKHREQLDLSINAFQHAVQIYRGLLDVTTEPQWVVNHHLAAVYFQLGETYSLDPALVSTIANDYLIQSDELFRFILETKQQPRVDPISRRSVEIAWSSCALRLGANLLGPILQPSLDDHDDEIAHVEELMQQEFMKQQGEGSNMDMDWQAWLRDHPEHAAKLADVQQKTLRQVDRAAALFDKSIQLLRKAVTNENSSDSNDTLRSNLATALQNRGTAAVLQGHLEDSVKYMEESAQIYQQLLDNTRSANEASAVADALYSLADSYLQLGRHDESTDRYNRAMILYRQYRLAASAQPPASAMDAAGGTQESIVAYEHALQDYHNLMNDPTNDAEGGGLQSDADAASSEQQQQQQQVVYEQDDGYEGDLYTTLGSLYLMMGDYITAESNLLQAIRLYDLSGEDADRTMADAKFNLAAIYFQKQMYQESAEIRSDALSIYHDVVGEDINPISDGMPVLDLSEFQSRHTQQQRQQQQTAPEEASNEAQQEQGTTRTEGEYETVISMEHYEEAMANDSLKDEL